MLVGWPIFSQGEWGVEGEEAKLVPADGASGDWLGYDVDLYGVTDIIGYPFDNAMGIDNGYVYIFSDSTMENGRRHRNLIPEDAEAGDWFGVSVAIYGDTPAIGSQYDNERGDDSGYGYMYTIIGGKWKKSGKIVPEDGAAYGEFGYNFPLQGINDLFGALYAGEESDGSVYIVDLFVP